MVVMAQTALKRKGETAKTGIGSRRIFPPHFKLQVLDSYRGDADCKGNQRATARKYGIHRRQIQKWLQAEANLRNSVGGGKGKCGGIELALRGGAPQQQQQQQQQHHRQRDDSAADAYSQCARIPSPDAYSESALDCTTPRAPLLPLPPPPLLPVCDLSAPIDLSLKRPISAPPSPPMYQPPAYHHNVPAPIALQSPDIWDLSIKREPTPLHSPASSTTPKPVKLFKPYLDDLHDNSNSSSSGDDSKKPGCAYHSTYETHYYNNNIYEFKSEYTYTLHELQPKTYYYHPSYLYEDPHHQTPLKQRQSYSLDFKLRAIECYYQDESCRGNQRAVATKYNIHRRQVQKWLKQEEELRQRKHVR